MAAVAFSLTAGSPLGAPAFFALGSAAWDHLLQRDSLAASGALTQWLAGVQGEAWTIELGMDASTQSGLFRSPAVPVQFPTHQVQLHAAEPRAYAILEARQGQSSLAGLLDGSGAALLGGGLRFSQRWQNLEASFTGSRRALELMHFNWQDSIALPSDGIGMGGNWRSLAWGLGARLAWEPGPWRVAGNGALTATRPARLEEHYGLRDTSLWAELGLQASRACKGWRVGAELLTLSGNLRVEGLRQSDGDLKRFAAIELGVDKDDAWLSIAPDDSLSVAPVQARDFGGLPPQLELALPRLQLNPRDRYLRLGFTWVRAILYPPSEALREETFAGNRLQDPSLLDIYGYTWYKKSLLANGSLRVRAYRMQGAWSWWGDRFGAQVGADLSHWKADLEGQAIVQTKAFLGSDLDVNVRSFHGDLILAEPVAGLGFKFAGRWTFMANAAQLVPLYFRLDPHSASQAIAAQGAGRFRVPDGLRVSAQIRCAI